MFAGLMPNRSIGADAFRVSHPTHDGRGVIIGILDSGIDPELSGLRMTSTGERKVVDIRDFSSEGRIALTRLSVGRDGTATVGGQSVTGLGRARAVATAPYFGGTFREITLGAAPAGDLNGDGDISDIFALVVGRASDGWVAVIDADGDRSFRDERPIRDYAVAGETLRFRNASDADGPMTVAVNLAEVDGVPQLDLVMDNSSHGSHVAGIAAGHQLFGVEGFDGVAPGAHLLALKISNNTRGGISVSGSMLQALDYAANFASRRGQSLILNLSYGVGNEIEGMAAIDALVDQFALDHPDVLLVISAGNDGPGISTLGLPGSAEQALTVCALFPGVFAKPPDPSTGPARDVMGWWSARGGEVAKPDVCAAGVAYSNVPRWRLGEEVSGGTSMAAPQVAGAAALLQSAMRATGHPVRAVDLKHALMATAKPLGGTTVLDEGRGVIDVPAAYQWLRAAHQTGVYRVRAMADGGNTSRGGAAYRRNGLASSADTVQTFEIVSLGGQSAARLLLRPDVPWIHAPAVLEPEGGPATVRLTYDAAALSAPGLYVGTVWATPASDTLAGPSFALTNTLVVPHALLQPLQVRGMLTPAAVARYFVSVAAERGGLHVSVEVDGPNQAVSLYVFEPNGQPHRGGGSVIASGAGERSTITVAEEDIVPGVYEVVVVAPPIDPAGYSLSVAQQGLAITAIDSGPVITVRNALDRQVRAEVQASLIGATRTFTVNGSSGQPEHVAVRVPEWAHTMVVDVTVPQDIWHGLTDLGVTVFDSLGGRIADNPLNYAVSRHAIEIDSLQAGTVLDVELFPAFDRAVPLRSWRAAVRMSFLTERHPLATLADSSTSAVVWLIPAERAKVSFRAPAQWVDIPREFEPLLAVTARPDGGAVAIRHGAVKLAPPPPSSPAPPSR
jgi:subtilisin family serine protease